MCSDADSEFVYVHVHGIYMQKCTHYKCRQLYKFILYMYMYIGLCIKHGMYMVVVIR